MCYNNNNHSVDTILASSPKYANTKTVRNLLIKAYELGQEESQKGVIKRKGIKLGDILSIVSECSNISEEQIRGKSKKEDIAIARKIAIYLIFNNTHNYSETGRMVNKKYTTVMFHIDNFSGLLRSSAKTRYLLTKILNKIDEKQRCD